MFCTSLLSLDVVTSRCGRVGARGSRGVRRARVVPRPAARGAVASLGASLQPRRAQELFFLALSRWYALGYEGRNDKKPG